VLSLTTQVTAVPHEDRPDSATRSARKQRRLEPEYSVTPDEWPMNIPGRPATSGERDRVATSVSAVLEPAGIEKSQGLVTAAYSQPHRPLKMAISRCSTRSLAKAPSSISGGQCTLLLVRAKDHEQDNGIIRARKTSRPQLGRKRNRGHVLGPDRIDGTQRKTPAVALSMRPAMGK
jgi:hypothetical protein